MTADQTPTAAPDAREEMKTGAEREIRWAIEHGAVQFGPEIVLDALDHAAASLQEARDQAERLTRQNEMAAEEMVLAHAALYAAEQGDLHGIASARERLASKFTWHLDTPVLVATASPPQTSVHAPGYEEMAEKARAVGTAFGPVDDPATPMPDPFSPTPSPAAPREGAAGE